MSDSSPIATDLAASLHGAFADLPDPRSPRNRQHPLINIVTIALCAVVANADDFCEFEQFGLAQRDWLARFLDLSRGIPSHDTFNRFFARLDPTRWQSCFLDWVRFTLHGQLAVGDVIALDGKRLCGSLDPHGSAAHLVNAWSTKHGLCLAQAAVACKSNEITALPDLIETLDLLDLEGCTVSVDAMGAQREVARLLTEKGASHLLALKDNQPLLAQDVNWLFDDAARSGFQDVEHDYAETNEYGHGRQEQRRCWVLPEVSFLEPHDWPGLTSVVRVEATRTFKGKTSTESRYFLSSVAGGAAEMLSTARAHWGVENGLHWVLDVVFKEDGHRAWRDHAPANLGVLRQLVLNLLKRTPSPKGKDAKGRETMSLKNKRKRAGWDNHFRELVLMQL